LKKKGGRGGSNVAGGCYLNMREGIRAEYLHYPWKTTLEIWYRHWFLHPWTTKLGLILRRIFGPRENWQLERAAAEHNTYRNNRATATLVEARWTKCSW
jgi:hypothetical protein